ncbi:hypothetical protein NLM24_17890 [Nocardia zapadnayensis]|uniref:hypothetical protein n=1 Tax=Nocardia rhamnosiphila TaxID=426716 RepID=UPI00224545A7|nr:hypothetical protein [Nocardia zapadnayensis]MCX0272539.1 hypothetical protein [Nocardia zapadnayensis]
MPDPFLSRTARHRRFGIFCNFTVSCRDAASIAANEAPYYRGAADFDALVAPGVAHNLTLHPSAPATFAAMNHWITTGDL